MAREKYIGLQNYLQKLAGYVNPLVNCIPASNLVYYEYTLCICLYIYPIVLKYTKYESNYQDIEKGKIYYIQSCPKQNIW